MSHTDSGLVGGRSDCHSSASSLDFHNITATGTSLNSNEIIRYDGDLRASVRHGKGNLKFRGGAEYDGQWLHGRMAGHGTYRWPDAMVYEGEWEAGLRSGNGTLTLPNGERLNSIISGSRDPQSLVSFFFAENPSHKTLEYISLPNR